MVSKWLKMSSNFLLGLAAPSLPRIRKRAINFGTLSGYPIPATNYYQPLGEPKQTLLRNTAIRDTAIGALVVTHAMLRRLTSWRCIIIIISVDPRVDVVTDPQIWSDGILMYFCPQSLCLLCAYVCILSCYCRFIRVSECRNY